MFWDAVNPPVCKHVRNICDLLKFQRPSDFLFRVKDVILPGSVSGELQKRGSSDIPPKYETTISQKQL